MCGCLQLNREKSSSSSPPPPPCLHLRRRLRLCRRRLLPSEFFANCTLQLKDPGAYGARAIRSKRIRVEIPQKWTRRWGRCGGVKGIHRSLEKWQSRTPCWLFGYQKYFCLKNALDYRSFRSQRSFRSPELDCRQKVTK